MRQADDAGAGFLKHATVMFVGSMLVAATNYAFYPAIARLLTVNQFGEVQTLVSLYLQLAIVLAAVNVSTVRLLVDQVEGCREIILGFNLGVYYAFFALAAVGLLCIRWIARFFQFESMLPIGLLCAALILSVPVNFWLAYMQGFKDFVGYNHLNFISSLSKLLLAIGLVLAGFGVSGAIGAIIAGQLVALAFVRAKNRALPSLRPFWTGMPVQGALLKPHLGVLVPGIVATVTLTFLYTADVFFAKHFFSPAVAGNYTGISSVARIVFFVCAPVSAVLLATIERGRSDENEGRLRTSMGLVLLLGGGAATAFSIFPGQFVGLVLGGKFSVESRILRDLSLAFLLLSFFNVLLYNSLSLRRTGETLLSLLASVAYTAAIVLFHSSPQTIATIALSTSVAVVAAAMVIAAARKVMEGRKWAKNLS